jgi:hypothetical protein
LNLWLILVAIWLAPAFIVGLLLFVNARRHDGAGERESDAPPAE